MLAARLISAAPGKECLKYKETISPSFNALKFHSSTKPIKWCLFYEGHASVGLYMFCAGKVKLSGRVAYFPGAPFTVAGSVGLKF